MIDFKVVKIASAAELHTNGTLSEVSLDKGATNSAYL